MENDDLKSMWQEIHTENPDNRYNRINIEGLTGRNHSLILTKVVTDVKWKIAGYCLGLIILTGLMIFAWGYLKLNLSVTSAIPFLGSGLYLLIQASKEIIRLNVLTKSAENCSVKESLIFFRRKVARMKIIDFLSYLIFFYLSAIWVIYLDLKDIGGIKNIVTGNEIQPLIIIFLFLLLAIPWFMKYQNNHRYKKLFSDLNSSANYLDDAT